MEIKNLKKAAERIKKAIKNREKIILYGDADLDGTTSLILLKESIKNLGGEITAIYFPDREKEGYGLTQEALHSLKINAPAFLITLDLGISNFKEISLAEKMGFEVMIIDHHEILDKLPEAKIIVDPKQKGDKASLQYLATVGIVYKLSELLFLNEMSQELKQSFLEIVALGTIADAMPREGENEIMIAQGLQSIANSWRPGIKAFFRERSFEKYDTACGVNVDVESIKRSIEIIMNSKIEYEFRTTAVPDITDESDIESIAASVKGAKKYVLQQFIPKNAMDEKLRNITPYEKDVFEKMMEKAKKYVKNAMMRGV